MNKSSAGFTLIELLVTIAILMILAGIALTGVVVYKERAYIATSEQMMQQARTALEAGKQDSAEFPSALMEVDQSTGGVLADPVAKLLMPGLVLPEHFRVYATHDPTCAVAGCMEDYIQTRHCLTSKKVVYFRTYGGIEATAHDVNEPAPCR